MLFLHWIGNRLLSLSPTCSTTRRCPTWRPCYKLVRPAVASTRSRLRADQLRHRARDHREAPQARGSASTRCRSRTRGASSTRARRSPGSDGFVGPVDPRQVPLRSTDVTGSPRWAAVVVNYEAGAAAGRLRRVAPRRHQRRARPSSSSSTTARATTRSPSCADRHPEVRVVERRRNLGYAARRQPRDPRRPPAPIVAVLQPRHRASSRAPRGAGQPARRRAAPGGGAALGCSNLDGTDYPSARRCPSIARSRSATGLLGLLVAAQPVHPPLPPARRRPAQPRAVDWVSGAAIWLRRAALDEVGGWDERYFMYLEDIDLCWRLRHAGLGGRLRAGAASSCTCRGPAPTATRTACSRAPSLGWRFAGTRLARVAPRAPGARRAVPRRASGWRAWCRRCGEVRTR